MSYQLIQVNISAIDSVNFVVLRKKINHINFISKTGA